MNKFKIIVFLFFSVVSWCTAQQVKFKRVYGGNGYDYGYSAVQTYDKGYAVAGVTSSFGYGNADMYLVKTDSLGLPLWYNIYGGINIDRGLSIKQTLDTGYVIAGYTNSEGISGYNMYLVKTDKNGDTLWTRTYGGTDWDFANAIQQTNDGGYILAGGTYSFGNGDEDVYLVKLNSVGDTVWTKTYGGIHQEEALAVYQTADSGYILTGYTTSFGAGGSDIYYIKTTSTGDTTWTKTLGGPGDDRGNSIAQVLGGGYILAGYKNDTTAHINQAYIAKINIDGSTIWVQQFGAPNNAVANAVVEDTDAGYVWAGKLNINGQNDIYFYKLDINGGYVFATTHGTNNGDEEGFFCGKTTDGGYFTGGTTNGIGYGLNDAFFVKTDSVGQSVATITVDVGNKVNVIPNIKVYPNPLSDRAFVQITANNKAANELQEVTIYDIAGKKVYFENQPKSIHSNLQQEVLEINVNGLENGIYLLQLNFSNSISHQKFIVQH
jgi:hypothetical protein